MKAIRTIPTSTIGTASELVVSADLLRQGYEVFRALSPSCSCDLIASKDGRVKRIEVRTGTRSKRTGRLQFLRNSEIREDVLDHYAVVVDGSEVVYLPSLRHKNGNGQGSVYHESKTGRWVAAVTTGVDDHGRLIRRRKYATSQAGAETALLHLQDR